MKPFLSSREVAEYLNVHPQTLDRWASTGKGPDYIKIEGIRRYDRAELNAWLEERTVRHG